MPFVQRVIQPTYLSRCSHGSSNRIPPGPDHQHHRPRTTTGAVVARQSKSTIQNTATTNANSPLVVATKTTTTTTRVLVHSNAALASVEPSVSNNVVATLYNPEDEEDASSCSHSPPSSSSTSNCCCNCCCSGVKQHQQQQKQHCCKNNVASIHNNNNNNNNNKSKGTIIGSCCNGKTNSLSSFSYSTADIDIEVVDDEVDSSSGPVPSTTTNIGNNQSHSQRLISKCRGTGIGVSLEEEQQRLKASRCGEREEYEKNDEEEFLTSRRSHKRSGYDDDGGIDCYSSCNGKGSKVDGIYNHHDHEDDVDDEEDEDDVDALAASDEDDVAVPSSTINQQQPSQPMIVTGYELESISNITLSNALRQLASLVIIASDIFHNLNKELQNVGDKTRSIKTKIDLLDKKVSGFDPKLVTVPESDLGTFAQRKTHYHCDKSFHKELFTSETRPTSVKVLYEEAAKISQECRLQASRNDTTTAAGAAAAAAAALDNNCTGALDELVCTPVFGKANRKMRTRIDAEIEIRLPAGIEDLRKWTSSEALGDVTVTPDCMNRVDASISTSMVIGDNGVLTPALSPSVLSADAVDAIYSINNSNDNLHNIPNDINKDVPLNHRLPSPEEQCKLLALRYPAEVISVDTSGKRFERMCLARKSTTGCALGMSESNNLNDDVQTVSRRSRSRKVRGKRRNTIAGIDQKEIQDAANGTDTHDSSGKNNLAESTTTPSDTVNPNEGYNITTNDNEKNKFGRSKSSDILKKESVALPYDKGKSTLTRLNSLKQWGRNRFKFITPNSGSSKSSSSGHQTNTNKSSPPKSGSSQTTTTAEIDIDDECIVHELTSKKNELFEKDSRFSHERKPSYSSSEKSVSLASNNGKMSQNGVAQKLIALGSSGNVKLRDTSSLNRQRRNGINNNGHNKDEPHSSSGNWSASSESGRTSIGSEITIQPKSSASNTSLNVSSFHPGSGPPSSIISRRRFLNTSASSSVTSEGTATPDLQVNDDDETSSAYSCDTEGYYTSFHMDSGLRTLKEEEPMSPLQTSSTHPSNYSFGSVSNQTVLTAENEYELFGRGSTSTTTSSAGTVCTTLLVNDHGPDVPERISSLSKLNNSASTSTLERSYSSSTVGSTLERTGTIKRNVLAVVAKEVAEEKHNNTDSSPASQESDFTFEQRIAERSAQPLPLPQQCSEVEYSESSDLEGVERIERIKQKTAMTAKRIPSMCIITPSTSDDENIKETTPSTVNNYATPYATIDMIDSTSSKKDHNLNHLKRTLQYPLHNMLDKLKVVLPNNKRKSPIKLQEQDDANIYDAAGEYVTIADISNNNNNKKTGGNLGIYYSNDIVRRNLDPTTLPSSSSGILPGSEFQKKEYISLNELPCNIRRNSQTKGNNILAHPFALYTAADDDDDVDDEKINSQLSCAASGNDDTNQVSSPSRSSSSSKRVKEDEIITSPSTSSAVISATANKVGGARVKMNSQGKAIYDSDSLKRRKGAHTTFAPGPYVKETESALSSFNNPNQDQQHHRHLHHQIIRNSNDDVDAPPPSESLIITKTNNINGGFVNRKVPNVRPIISSTSQHRPPLIVNMTTKCLDRPPPPLPQTMATIMAPMPSSLSSTSSSSTLTSSSNSSSTSTSSTASTSTVLDEGYHRFSKIGTPLTTENPTSTTTHNPSMDNGIAFNRNAPVYWTLQNRRQSKPSPTTAGTCRDDLYAVPISRANRNAALTKSNAELQRSTNISPIVPRNKSNFFTSTPTKSYQNAETIPTAENTPAMQPSSRSFQKGDENNPERLNTCSDRIGNSKTTLMDFKKLLLAKSVKNTPVKKLSAVELLKMNKREAEKAEAAAAAKDNKASSTQSLNSTMTLLDLSGSPKTFANRRMLRQGQFGSPSKSFAPKQRSAQWRMNSMRTDVISTTIPEANSEEDHSNSSGGSNHSGSKPSSEAGDSIYDRNELISEEKMDLKKNIFLQTEENNFMKGELKIPFGRTTPQIVGKYVKNAPQLVGNKPLGVSPSPNYTISSLSPATNAAHTANRNYNASELILKSNNTNAASQNIQIIAASMNKEATTTTISPALETAL
ncbi:serine-rich adhesin for platelets [Episyrphus balteatus]|uniref:serine-rich adhesin for platelets n=1 Tax=Episyrphus balteatus TaxID=286459 RepID=UPI0024852C3C|nr:serine-rich adhesin for platelets [Episyrphus balteatus]